MLDHSGDPHETSLSCDCDNLPETKISSAQTRRSFLGSSMGGILGVTVGLPLLGALSSHPGIGVSSAHGQNPTIPGQVTSCAESGEFRSVLELTDRFVVNRGLVHSATTLRCAIVNVTDVSRAPVTMEWPRYGGAGTFTQVLELASAERDRVLAHNPEMPYTPLPHPVRFLRVCSRKANLNSRTHGFIALCYDDGRIQAQSRARLVAVLEEVRKLYGANTYVIGSQEERVHRVNDIYILQQNQ